VLVLVQLAENAGCMSGFDAIVSEGISRPLTSIL
jgi:hypothetical protein